MNYMCNTAWGTCCFYLTHYAHHAGTFLLLPSSLRLTVTRSSLCSVWSGITSSAVICIKPFCIFLGQLSCLLQDILTLLELLLEVAHTKLRLFCH